MLRELLQQIGNLFRWFIIVAPWEQAIRVRAGKHQRLLSAGLYLRIPFLDRIYLQSTRRRISTIAPQTITNLSGKTITLSCCVGYAIEDLMKLYEKLHDAADTIDAEVGAIVAGFVVTNEDDDCTPQILEAYVRDRLTLEEYGLRDPEFYVINWADVKTVRLLTGELKYWQNGNLLDTSRHDAQMDHPNNV